jgi:hypothetical protein
MIRGSRRHGAPAGFALELLVGGAALGLGLALVACDSGASDTGPGHGGGGTANTSTTSTPGGAGGVLPDGGPGGGNGGQAGETPDAGPQGPDPSILPVTYTRPDEGTPLTPAELTAATGELIALLQGTRYFDVVDERVHGWPESDPAHGFWWGSWWSGITVTKLAGQVSYTHSSDGADNNGLRTAPLVEGACYAHLLWGAELTRHLLQRLVRGYSAAALSMKRYADDPAQPLLSRTHYAVSFTSYDGGHTIAVDTSADRPGIDGTSEYVHLATNPTFGDIWIKNKRSKDDMGQVFRSIVQADACTLRLSADGQADMAQMRELYAAWSRQVEADSWGIATLDKNAQVWMPPLTETLAHYTLVGNVECPGVLMMRLLGDGDPGSLDCGSGISLLETLGGSQFDNGVKQILRTHHEAAVNMAFSTAALDPGLALLKGLATRVEQDLAAVNAGDPDVNPSDIAALLLHASNAGVPLTSSEVRWLHGRLHLALQTYLAPGTEATYRLFDAATPDGSYPFEPGGDGLSFQDIGVMLGACAAPYRNPATRPLLDCTQLEAAF